MKKRFFNALLLGAVLLSTNAVTSCKDYDDDINNLQEQINKLATADELKSAVEQLNSAVTAAKEDAAKALEAAKTAQSTADTKADAATVTELQAAVAQAAADLATAQTELTELINSKASADDLAKANEKIAAAEQAIEEAKKAASDADDALKGEMTQAIAEALEDYVTKAALEVQVAELNAKINTLVGEKVAEQMEELQAELEKLQGIADKLQIAYSTMITDVQLYHHNQSWMDESFDYKLNFIQATELDNEFYAFGTQDGWTFKKGEKYLGTDSVLVRVSPANAVLSKENLSLIDSQGREISDVVEIASVEKFERLLTTYRTRANASETGLWVVKFQAKDVDEAFAAAAIDKSQGYERSIVYAVAVKNDNANVNTDRRVTSEYALSLYTQVASHGYEFAVNETDVNYIHNRYWACEDSRYTTEKVPELNWIDQHNPGVKAILDGTDRNAADRYADRDNRQGKYCLAVEKGKPITIDFTNGFLNFNVPEDEGVEWHQGDGIKGFYVTLDDKFALESTPSEINAWTSYEYVGVGYTKANGEVVPSTLFQGNVGTIVVKDMNNVAGDIIGFRVYAVNYDGTLTDPDGRAFYVAVGDVKTDVAISQNPVEVKYQEFNNELKFVSDLISTDAFDVDFNGYVNWNNNTTDLSGIHPEFRVVYYDEGKDEISLSDVYNEDKKIAYVRFVLDEPGNYIDGGEYTQAITLTKSSSLVSTTDVRTITASIKKVMPTGPAYEYMVAQNTNQWPMPVDQKGNNTYVISAFGDNFVPANATIDLNNFLVSERNLYTAGNQALKTEDGQYRFDIANSTYNWNNLSYKWNLDKAVVEAIGGYRNQTYTLKIYNEPSADERLANIIDNTTKHAIEAAYTYDGISKRVKTAADEKDDDDDCWDKGYVSFEPYTVSLQKNVDPVVFCSWTQSFALKTAKDSKWDKNNNVTWYEDPRDVIQLDLKNVEFEIKGNIILSVKPTSTSLGALIEDGYLEVLDADIKNLNSKAWTTANGQINPYWQASFQDPQSSSLLILSQINQKTQTPNLGSENINFKVRDCFGNVIDIVLPFDVTEVKVNYSSDVD